MRADMTPVASGDLRGLPTALLHDHLDGGLRPQTVVELADAVGHQLPMTDVEALTRWFKQGGEKQDILTYLKAFEHTVGVMQTAEALRRVAQEAVEDLAADGVVYAEVRFAPELHQRRGLTLDQVVEAVQEGFSQGMATAVTPAGHPVVVNTIVCAMRTERRSLEVAELAARWRKRDPRVVAFDLAGAETGWPASLHTAALGVARAELVHVTIHASEPPDLLLIADALEQGADRIGHGVRLATDVEGLFDEAPRLGRLAAFVRDQQMCLEMAPTCHVQVGAVPSLPEHPIGPMLRLGFNVTVNTDNRLMSDVTVGGELEAVASAHQLGTADCHQLVRNAVSSGFGDFAERRRILSTIVDPAWEVATAGAAVPDVTPTSPSRHA